MTDLQSSLLTRSPAESDTPVHVQTTGPPLPVTNPEPGPQLQGQENKPAHMQAQPQMQAQPFHCDQSQMYQPPQMMYQHAEPEVAAQHLNQTIGAYNKHLADVKRLVA